MDLSSICNGNINGIILDVAFSSYWVQDQRLSTQQINLMHVELSIIFDFFSFFIMYHSKRQRCPFTLGQ